MKYDMHLLPTTLLRPHEQINRPYANKLAKQIANDGYLANPVIVDKHTLIILDGHHRFNALKKLGVALVPVCLCRL